MPDLIHNILCGTGTVLELFPQEMPSKFTSYVRDSASDQEMLARDWLAVGSDLWGAVYAIKEILIDPHQAIKPTRLLHEHQPSDDAIPDDPNQLKLWHDRP